MTPIVLIVLAVLLWVAVSVLIAAAVAFATGGTYPSPLSRKETVSCSNF